MNESYNRDLSFYEEKIIESEDGEKSTPYDMEALLIEAVSKVKSNEQN